MRDLEGEALHVPGAGGAPLGAEAAVQADVLVLHHHTTRGQRSGDVDILLQVRGRGLKAGPQVPLLALGGGGGSGRRAKCAAGGTRGGGGVWRNRTGLPLSAGS